MNFDPREMRFISVGEHKVHPYITSFFRRGAATMPEGAFYGQEACCAQDEHCVNQHGRGF
jgi:hypothetical protein